MVTSFLARKCALPCGIVGKENMGNTAQLLAPKKSLIDEQVNPM
ncbi:hypothetical protein [Williamwhitmania taraxaci]|nr:hypothetical protein [Williamwhitmania taraxaci]